jgi:hypothetical protein
MPADEQVLTTFFEQSRLYDTTRVAGVSKVVFDPRIEGVVERYRIVNRADHAVEGNRLQRQSTLVAHVRTGAGAYDRTLRITMERSAEGRWMVLAFHWGS